MTTQEFGRLRHWFGSPSCPRTRVALTDNGQKIYRTYLHDKNPNRMWTEASTVIREIDQCYRAVQRVTVDINLGIMVTKLVLWEEIFPGDHRLVGVENPAPPITKTLWTEWTGEELLGLVP